MQDSRVQKSCTSFSCNCNNNPIPNDLINEVFLKTFFQLKSAEPYKYPKNCSERKAATTITLSTKASSDKLESDQQSAGTEVLFLVFFYLETDLFFRKVAHLVRLEISVRCQVSTRSRYLDSYSLDYRWSHNPTIY